MPAGFAFFFADGFGALSAALGVAAGEATADSEPFGIAAVCGIAGGVSRDFATALPAKPRASNITTAERARAARIAHA